jgi:hypothetical protein
MTKIFPSVKKRILKNILISFILTIFLSILIISIVFSEALDSFEGKQGVTLFIILDIIITILISLISLISLLGQNEVESIFTFYYFTPTIIICFFIYLAGIAIGYNLELLIIVPLLPPTLYLIIWTALYLNCKKQIQFN